MIDTILATLVAAKVNGTPLKVTRTFGAGYSIHPNMIVREVREEKRRGTVVIFADMTNVRLKAITRVEVSA